MRDVYDFAKFFVKNGIDTMPNTYDGNMKLQQMLVLSDMAHLALFRQPLFGDDILALENGFVIEKVLFRYRNDYFDFKADSERFNQDFNEEEYDTLNAVIGVYGHLTAKELSDLHHSFHSWQYTQKSGTRESGQHNKEKPVVDFTAFPEDIEAVGKAVRAYKETQKIAPRHEVVNGVRFYYDDMVLTDDIISELEKFSRFCEDDAYSIYMDDGRLVIF